jgi:hypothetical protein
MEDALYSSNSVESITTLITECQFPQDAYVLVEMLPQHVVDKQERSSLLCFARLSDGVDLVRYTTGRVFNQQAELRWEKIDDGKYHAVYLGTKREISGLKKDEKDQQELDSLERAKETKNYYLFGEYLNAEKLTKMGIHPKEGYYAEVRIPRLLHYPAPTGAQRVQLKVLEYLDRDTGEVKLFRFQGVKAAE